VLESPCPGGCRQFRAFTASLVGKWRPNPIEAGAAVEAIAAGRREGRPVLVHCASGVERSPAVAALYLLRCEGLALSEAYAVIRQARPQVRFAPELLRVDGADGEPSPDAQRSAEP